MSILIKGMEMPTSGELLVIITPNGEVRYKKSVASMWDRTTAVPVPPHGDTIDRDAFIAAQRHLYCDNCDRRRGMKDGKLTKKFVYAIGDAPCRACYVDDMLDSLEEYAPTIIPASEEGE